jgi:hypothetical protein
MQKASLPKSLAGKSTAVPPEPSQMSGRSASQIREVKDFVIRSTATNNNSSASQSQTSATGFGMNNQGNLTQQ